MKTITENPQPDLAVTAEAHNAPQTGVSKFTPNETLAVAPSPIQMMQAIIVGGVTKDNVLAFEKLAELQWKFEARDSERSFNISFVKLQKELPIIVASTVIKNRGKYEKFEDIMRQIAPHLAANGFSVSFSQPDTMPAGRIAEICHLAHEGGHSRKHTCAVRTHAADNETQSDSMAMTTAKRNALIQALNLVIRQDCLNEEEDAGIEGDPSAFITKEQVSEFQHRIGMLGDVVDMPAFWKFAQALKFAEIPARRYNDIDLMLTRKEKSGR
jgi:hypothetical protein